MDDGPVDLAHGLQADIDQVLLQVHAATLEHDGHPANHGRPTPSQPTWCDGKPWEQCGYLWEPEAVIWPTWPGRSADEVATSAMPLAGVEEYWRTVGNRLRDSAKWMATVLGAALAAVAGTSPLAG